MRSLLAGLAVTVLVVAVAAPATAGPEAPRYVTSDPGDGATVDQAPSRVTATFSEPLDSSSTLHVYDECGAPVDAGDTQVLGSRMDVGIAKTPSGHYTVVYDAVGFGGATGETKDDFSFHVSSGTPCDGASHHHHGTEHEGHEGGGHEGHGGHGTEHEGHGGHAGHGGGHEDHASHEGHSAHAGHSDHAGHAGHPAAHSGHDAAHHHHGSTLAGVKPGFGHKGGSGQNGGSDGLVNPRLAAGAGRLGLAPTTQSVLIALALAMAMGALGGWVLRVSSAH